MEPWLAGAYSELAPVPRLLCCSLAQSLEDVERWTADLDDDAVWRRPIPGDVASVGFQLRHLAGSVDRLLTYARGETIREEQLQFLRAEAEPGATREELLAGVRRVYADAAAYAQSAIDLEAPRFIGRKRLETPHGVLLAHIAEHTQRHTGQLIVLAKLAGRG